MPEERTRYWYNSFTLRIHKQTCGNCPMSKDGVMEWDDGARPNWWGPYETLGAAIDVAVATRGEAVLCGTCGDQPPVRNGP